jgi:acetolactate synthase I/II/III large subunit
MATNADRIIEMLREAGVSRLFGMPGGGSPADLIAAAGRAGFPFTLAHAETAAAFMAAAQAEITGRCGACVATLGPGAASLINGVSHAFLDRVPLLAITDHHATGASQHQTLPHAAMFAPIVKLTTRDIDAAFDALVAPPPGAVHLDLSTAVAGAAAESPWIPPAAAPSRCELTDEERRLLAQSRRPLALVGLHARTAAVRGLPIPKLVTYKSKGVVPDDDPWFAGIVTNGPRDREIVDRADVLIEIGFDHVELMPGPWKFPHAVVAIGAEKIEALRRCLPETEWSQPEICHMVSAHRRDLQPDGDGLRPHRVVELAAEVYPRARVTVDAGAHMLPVMGLWPARNPCDVLISNGLCSMGFAVPSAIGAALLDRERPVVAFTGDGGLLMCLAELRTAARERLAIRVIVFDDGALSLIKLKQIRRGFPADGVSIGEVDWVSVGEGLGARSCRADSEESLHQCLRETERHPGPVLISAWINPATYQDIIRSLRGPG